MTAEQQLQDKISSLHLLKHPFYQAWMKGELSAETLQHYAIQYYPHVKIFPRLVSAIHSRCEDSQSRQFLLENLNEEEGFPNGQNHPELWLRFAEGLGSSRAKMNESEIGAKAQELAGKFWDLCNTSYPEGLAALYAYEYQVPEIAKAKIEGLKAFYGIQDARTLAFFAVHEKADVFHSQACAKLLNELPPADLDLALAAGHKAASALWDFLSEVYEAPCGVQ